MKKAFKILIAPVSLVFIAGAFFLLQSFTLPDGGEGDKEVTIKVIKVVNGVETVVDTTITIPEGGDIQSILSAMDLGVDISCTDSLLQTIDFTVDGDGEVESTIKMCVKVNGEEGNIDVDSLLKSLDIYIDGEGETKSSIVISTDEDGSVTTKKNVKKIIINKDGQVIKGDDENVKIMMFDTDDGDIKIDAIIDEDGNVNTEEILKTLDIEILGDGEGDVIVETIKVECDGEDVKVFKTDAGDHTIIIKTDIKIIELNDDELKTLEKSGAKTNSTNALVVEKLNFYPNPNDGKFNLKFNLEEKGNTNVKVFDINGKEVYSESLKNFSGEYNKDLDLTSKGKGTYFINIEQNGKVINKKIVVQ